MVLTIASHLDVSLIAPGVAPRVLHDIVVLTLFVRSETDGQHTVIEILRVALGVKVNALRVELERLLRRINGDRHRADGGQSQFQFIFVTLRHINEALIGGTRVLCVITACVVLALVRIQFLGVDSAIVLDVLERIVHESAVAAVVAVHRRAIDQILFGQRHQNARLAEVLTLERTGRRERPARSAVALVLDRCHGALGAPVDRIGYLDVGRSQERDGLILDLGSAELGNAGTKYYLQIIHDCNNQMIDAYRFNPVLLKPLRAMNSWCSRSAYTFNASL